MSVKTVVRCFLEDNNKDHTSFMVLYRAMKQHVEKYSEESLIESLKQIDFSKIKNDSMDY